MLVFIMALVIRWDSKINPPSYPPTWMTPSLWPLQVLTEVPTDAKGRKGEAKHPGNVPKNTSASAGLHLVSAQRHCSAELCSGGLGHTAVLGDGLWCYRPYQRENTCQSHDMSHWMCRESRWRGNQLPALHPSGCFLWCPCAAWCLQREELFYEISVVPNRELTLSSHLH